MRSHSVSDNNFDGPCLRSRADTEKALDLVEAKQSELLDAQSRLVRETHTALVKTVKALTERVAALEIRLAEHGEFIEQDGGKHHAHAVKKEVQGHLDSIRSVALANHDSLLREVETATTALRDEFSHRQSQETRDRTLLHEKVGGHVLELQEMVSIERRARDEMHCSLRSGIEEERGARETHLVEVRTHFSESKEHLNTTLAGHRDSLHDRVSYIEEVQQDSIVKHDMHSANLERFREVWTTDSKKRVAVETKILSRLDTLQAQLPNDAEDVRLQVKQDVDAQLRCIKEDFSARLDQERIECEEREATMLLSSIRRDHCSRESSPAKRTSIMSAASCSTSPGAFEHGTPSRLSFPSPRHASAGSIGKCRVPLPPPSAPIPRT